jgi:septum formation protein
VDSDRRPRLVLASVSPARRRTLEAAGIDAEVAPSGVDESSVDLKDPGELCLTLARLKARAVAARTAAGATSAGETTGGGTRRGRILVLGCDSVLAFDGEALGKPGTPEEAALRWRRMRGRQGVLHTGHTVVDGSDGRLAEAVSAVPVHFADITDAEIAAYVATGEPLEVAGAFTIEGYGAPFIERIDGDPGTVTGLSMPLLRHLLAELGVPITSLWRTAAR